LGHCCVGLGYYGGWALKPVQSRLRSSVLDLLPDPEHAGPMKVRGPCGGSESSVRPKSRVAQPSLDDRWLLLGRAASSNWAAPATRQHATHSERHRTPTTSPGRHRTPTTSPGRHRTPTTSPGWHRTPTTSPGRHRPATTSAPAAPDANYSPGRHRTPTIHHE